MNLIIDFLLLAASGAACFYCWVLNTRLNKLSSSKDGLAAGVAALSQSAEDMQSAMVETKGETTNSVAHLEALLKTVDEKTPEVEAMLEEIKAISKQAVNETESATVNLVETLAPHIAEARKTASFLFSSLERASEQASAAGKKEETDHADNSASLKTESTPDGVTEADSDDLEFVIDVEENEAVAKGEAA